MTVDELQALASVKADVEQIKKVVLVLKYRSENEAENCPMRVDIARATNGASEARREAREAETLAMQAVKAAQDNKVDLAKLGAATAGGGAVGGLIFAIVNHLLGSL